MELRGDGAVLGGVDGLHIRVFKDDVLCEAVIAEGAQVEVEDDVIRQAAVDGEDGWSAMPRPYLEAWSSG